MPKRPDETAWAHADKMAKMFMALPLGSKMSFSRQNKPFEPDGPYEELMAYVDPGDARSGKRLSRLAGGGGGEGERAFCGALPLYTQMTAKREAADTNVSVLVKLGMPPAEALARTERKLMDTADVARGKPKRRRPGP